MAFLIVPLLAIPILSIVAMILAARNRSKLDECCRRIDELSHRLARMERPVAPVPAVAASPEPATFAPALSTPPTPLSPADVSEEAAVETPPAAPEPSFIEPPHAMPWNRPAEPAPESDLWGRVEEHVGKRWMSWAGALALFLGVGFFVKYAIDRQWIGPTTRVCLGAAFGILLIVLGCRSLRRKMRALGQGLVGGGLAMLYVSLFAAFEFYGLIPQSAAFVLMVLVSAVGMTLAAVHNAPPIAILAILGGFLTPCLVSTGRDERDILFAYLLLLDVSVLVLGYFRKWRLIEMLAFIGTAVLFSQWFDRFYSASAMLPTLIWVGMFYVIFAIAPFFANLVKKTPVAVERFLMTIAATLGAFGFAHRILHADHPHALGFIAMAMGACSLALGILFRKRIPGDNRSPLGHFALAMFFLTISIPIHFGLNATTLCWAAEGPLLLYLGYTFRYRPARLGGLAVLIISVIRLFAVHMPLHVDSFTLFLNTQFGTAMSVPVACGLFALIHHLYPDFGRKAERLQKIAVGIAGGFLALIILHVEMHQWFEYRAAALGLLRHYHAWSTACILWAAGAAAFLAFGCKARSFAARYAGLAALPVAIVMALLLYVGLRVEDCALAFNLRFAAALTPVLAALAHAFTYSRSCDASNRKGSPGAKPLHGLWILLLLVVLSAEVFKYFRWQVAGLERARSIAQMALTITWSVYAAVLLASGFWRRVRALRFAALALFGLAAIKLLVVDIADIKPLYRIISFVAVGLLMIAGSYLYHRLEKSLQADSDSPAEPVAGSDVPLNARK